MGSAPRTARRTNWTGLNVSVAAYLVSLSLTGIGGQGMRMAWFDSIGIAGGSGLFSVIVAGATALSALGFAALRNRAGTLAKQDAPDGPELEEILHYEPGLLSFRGERLDVATEARWAMSALAGRAARLGSRLELAVSPGLAVWMDPRAFRKLLAEIVAQAIGAAPCGRVLLTAAPHGGRVQIGVSHDSPAASREALETALRPAAEIAALNGGTLEVTVRAGQGGTVRVRLPEPAANPAPATDAAAAARADQGRPSAGVTNSGAQLIASP
jgi:hypothetical protein